MRGESRRDIVVLFYDIVAVEKEPVRLRSVLKYKNNSLSFIILILL